MPSKLSQLLLNILISDLEKEMKKKGNTCIGRKLRLNTYKTKVMRIRKGGWRKK